jgi:hypothetical protein
MKLVLIIDAKIIARYFGQQHRISKIFMLFTKAHININPHDYEAVRVYRGSRNEVYTDSFKFSRYLYPLPVFTSTTLSSG